MEVMLLRFDAPLMSFGAPTVDRRGVIQPFPALSMLVGLLGNALGYGHTDYDRLERLQERLRYASRQDRRGRQLRDYQTVDLSQEHMQDDRAWTTRGELEGRRGGSASSGTHIRLRDFWADAVHTVALTLVPAAERPGLDDLERAVQFPARPLFIGRKPCLPGAPLYAGRVRAESLVAALKRAELSDRADVGEGYRVWSPADPQSEESIGGASGGSLLHPVTDKRDWTNQIHVGQRWMRESVIDAPGSWPRPGEPPSV